MNQYLFLVWDSFVLRELLIYIFREINNTKGKLPLLRNWDGNEEELRSHFERTFPVLRVQSEPSADTGILRHTWCRFMADSWIEGCVIN